MINTIDVEWKDGLHFVAHQQGQEVLLDSSSEGTMRGVGPKQLLLTALAGCTAMDVASLLPKMRVPFTSIKVTVHGDLTEEHPKVYTSMKMIYEIGTTNEYRPQVERAVEKSTSTYCGVHAMLGKVAEITHEIVLTGH